MKVMSACLLVFTLVMGCKGKANYTGSGPFDLRLAAMTGDCNKINELLSQGVDIESPSPGGNTALHDAADGGQNEAIELLVKKGANINAQSASGATPLMSAVLNEKSETAKLLIRLGARTDLVDANGRTALEYAETLGVKLK